MRARQTATEYKRTQCDEDILKNPLITFGAAYKGR
jgi:hypothetical protein